MCHVQPKARIRRKLAQNQATSDIGCLRFLLSITPDVNSMVMTSYTVIVKNATSGKKKKTGQAQQPKARKSQCGSCGNRLKGRVGSPESFGPTLLTALEAWPRGQR